MSSDVVNSPDETHVQGLKSKKLLWGELRRMDSLDMETGTVHGQSHHSSRDTKDWSVILHLAFQSIGIVYGEIGTSPLYSFASTLTDGVKDNDDILGVLSLIFYTLTLTLIPLFKYVLIVLKANDNGDERIRLTRDYDYDASACDATEFSPHWKVHGALHSPMHISIMEQNIEIYGRYMRVGFRCHHLKFITYF
ncbi:unnamed protein product, partial [Vitis vinifera]|uniref:K+ potassium transporter integral membrane domain-containing protein n=1 Tax=Vitis vinifera TaxID=29760 RepID=D7TP12_VITVI